MSVLLIEDLWKEYRLGVIGHGTLSHDLQAWWARFKGKEDPNSKLGSFLPGQESQVVGDRFWALRGVGLVVEPGEVLGIIGRNGAGKSTLLKILSRVTAPTRGQIKVKGRIASLLEVGTGFHPELTGRENIFLNGAILGMAKAEVSRKIEEIIDFSGVEQHIDTPVKRYSSGMYVRLAFAVAAHMEPEILVVDEVLAVGDAEFQKRCLSRMHTVSTEGRTVLFVSHNMSVINKLCSRSILLDKGLVELSGETSKITEAYLSGPKGAGGLSAEWSAEDAPGIDGFRLLSVRILRKGEDEGGVIDVSESFDVEIRYLCSKPGLNFRCAVLFYALGVCAFATIERKEEVRVEPGEYVSAVTVPKNLLSELDYSVGVSVFQSKGAKQHFVRQKDVLRFQVVDEREIGTTARGDYAQNVGGVVRPFLNWRMEVL